MLQAGLSVGDVVSLTLCANRWQLSDLFEPLTWHLCNTPLSTPITLMATTRLLSLPNTPSTLRHHVTAHAARFLAHDLQATFPNHPSTDATALLHALHEANALRRTLSFATGKGDSGAGGSVLALVHGLFCSLGSRVGDSGMAEYMRAVPAAEVGVRRLFACDAATARWPARCVRVGACVAAGTGLRDEVAKIGVCVRIRPAAASARGETRPVAAGSRRAGGGSGAAAAKEGAAGGSAAGSGGALRVALDTVTVALEARREGRGVCVRARARLAADGGEEAAREWRAVRVGVDAVGCMRCGWGGGEGGGEVWIALGGGSGSGGNGEVRVEGEGAAGWAEEHGGCGDGCAVVGVEVEVLRAGAEVYGAWGGTGKVEVARMGSEVEADEGDEGDGGESAARGW